MGTKGGVRSTWAALALWGAGAAALPAVADDAASRARTDYLLHCSGCHGQDGMGNPPKGIPQFQDQVGHFVRIPEGRAFLMQVPGLLSSRLSDERAAAVTTWLLRAYGGASLPEDFVPYTAQEAKRYRETRPADVIGKRNALYAELIGRGHSFTQK